MKLMGFLVRYSPASIFFAVLAGVVSGASNAGLLAVFNGALKETASSRATLVWAFVALCLFLPATRFASELILARLAQGALYSLRMELCRKIMAVPLRRVEELGAHRLLTALTDDVPTITNTLVNIPLLCINIAIAVGGLIYLAWLSWVVLLLVLGFIVLGIITYQVPVAKAIRLFRLARKDGETLVKHFRSLVDGSKELKLHARRHRSFFKDLLQPTAAALSKGNLSAMRIYAAASSVGQILVFVVVGLVLFALPAMRSIDAHMLTGYTITLLYLMTPIQYIMNSIPGLGRADVSLKRIEELGITLESFGTEGERDVEPAVATYCERLELFGVTHSYGGDGQKDNFVLGPITMSLVPGELVFLVGGNGSGKTTLAKLIASLYIPETGEVRMNGQTVTDENREDARQYFSVVFSDFHLFESLLGLESIDLDQRAHDYLVQLQLEKKIEIKEGVLSSTDLSNGQRKRLALLTAYLEDRPIYIFDEWAADQDPAFKKIFYHELLPDLKARGKIVVVITHDDQYYHTADRIIKLEYGKVEYDKTTKADTERVMAGI